MSLSPLSEDFPRLDPREISDTVSVKAINLYTTCRVFRYYGVVALMPEEFSQVGATRRIWVSCQRTLF